MVIECVNHDGTHKTKAYHFGWGAGRPMFMVLSQFLTKVSFLVDEVEKLSDCLQYVDCMGLAHDLEDEWRQEMSKSKKEIKRSKESLRLQKFFRGAFLGTTEMDDALEHTYLCNIRNHTRWMRMYRRELKRLYYLSLDDMQSVREFVAGCDNNNGLMYVRFTAGEWTRCDRAWGVEMMVIPGNEDTGRRAQHNKPVTPRQYMKRYPLCTEEFVEMVESTLRYWEVSIVGVEDDATEVDTECLRPDGES